MNPVIKMRYGRERVQTEFDPEEPSMTEQHHKKSCDINHIMKKYENSGFVEHVNKYQGNYSDLSGLTSYHESMNIVTRAQQAFEQLPSNIRTQFSNDPGKFVEFVSNPDNKDEMEKMGLIETQPDYAPNFGAVDTPVPPEEKAAPVEPAKTSEPTE